MKAPKMLRDYRHTTEGSAMNKELTHMGLSKVERYNWLLRDTPGKLTEVSKYELFVDESYQRNSRDDKVLAIARDWSWVACGALIVARRDGRLYVVDGQHRLLASRRRDDIKTLPCIVFDTKDSSIEAAGFLQANTLRKPITSFDRFRAQIVIGDEHAKLVDALIEQSGRAAGVTQGSVTIGCISTLMSAARNNKQQLIQLWPLLIKVFEGGVVHSKVVAGLIYIESRMANGESLTDRRWSARLTELGSDKLVEAAQKAAAYHAAGGAKVWASGMLDLINKGLRNRLAIRGISALVEE